MSRFFRVSAIFIWLILPNCSWARPIQTIALTGTQAPGVANGNFFTNLGRPTIDAIGHVSFEASTTPLLRGYWSNRSGSLRANVLTTDDLADIFPHAVSTGVSHSYLTSGQLTSFFAGAQLTEEPPEIISGFVLQDSTQRTFSPVRKSGTPPPGIPEEYEYAFIRGFRFSMSPQGTIAFSAAVQRDPLLYYDDFVSDGIWLVDNEMLSLIAFEDAQAPGEEEGVTFFTFDTPIFGRDSAYLFGAGLQGGSVIGPSGTLWSNRSGNLEAIVRGNEQAPGTPDGTLFGHFVSNYTMNASNQIAFQTQLVSVDKQYSNRTSVWSEGSGELKMVAMNGQQAPDVEEGALLVVFEDSRIAFNDAGHIAFKAGLAPSSHLPPSPDWTLFAREGIWAERGDGLSLVARSNDPAPGLEDGYVLDLSDSEDVDINLAGQVVFHGITYCQTDACFHHSGIWAEDRGGNLQLIALEGQLIEVAPGDFREISELSSTLLEGKNRNALRRTINDLGQITFWAGFTDGTEGIFVSNAVAIPEPSTTSLLLCCLLSMVRPHRRPFAHFN